MLAKVASCAMIGLDGAIVQVEVDISPGLPAFTVVGLPDTAVQEGARACTRRRTQLRLLVPGQAYHRQPRPGRPAQGRPGL